MTKYAHVKDGVILRVKDLTDAEVADIPPHKAAYILPYTEVARPAFDSATHYAPVRDDDAILADRVEQVWIAGVAKTQAEIAAEVQERRSNAMDRLDQASSIDKVISAALFEVVNDVRVLKGQSEITAAQFKTWLRSKF